VCGFWNINGFNADVLSDNYAIRVAGICVMDADIVGVAETHLRGNEVLDIPGYKWYGLNRKHIHRRAPCGSGGVGFLVRETLLESYSVQIIDDNNDSILWIALHGKFSDFCIKACVCYLPPENSTRAVNPVEFYDTLLTGIYEQQDDGVIYICGDLNSRCGDMLDFIVGVDDVPERDVVDFTTNKYGPILSEFLRDGNMCMLNGRHFVTNDFTCIRPQGSSVVDYCLLP
jgi:exonuclease III